MTQGYHLDQSLPPRLSKSVFNNVLFEHGGLPHALSLTVHLDFSECHYVEGPDA